PPYSARASSPTTMQILASYRRLVATIARKYISKVTFELSAIIGEATTRKLASARLTMETSKALDTKPIHGRHRPRRSIHQIATDASPVASVTEKPVTCIGSLG